MRRRSPTSANWGAYGNKPNDDKQAPYDPKAPIAQQFGTPVHCVKLANDGLVYVCDRINNRIQVFRKDGTFVKEFFFEKNTLGNGAVWDIAIWPDPKQTYLLSADGENNETGSSSATMAAWSAASAAMPGNSTGCMPWRWMPRVTPIPPRSTPESASGNSS